MLLKQWCVDSSASLRVIRTDQLTRSTKKLPSQETTAAWHAGFLKLRFCVSFNPACLSRVVNFRNHVHNRPPGCKPVLVSQMSVRPKTIDKVHKPSLSTPRKGFPWPRSRRLRQLHQRPHGCGGEGREFGRRRLGFAAVACRAPMQVYGSGRLPVQRTSLCYLRLRYKQYRFRQMRLLVKYTKAQRGFGFLSPCTTVPRQLRAKKLSAEIANGRLARLDSTTPLQSDMLLVHVREPQWRTEPTEDCSMAALHVIGLSVLPHPRMMAIIGMFFQALQG